MQNNVNLAPGCSTSGQYKCEICPSQFPLKEDLIVHQLLFHSYSNPKIADNEATMNIQRRQLHHQAEVRSANHPGTFSAPGLSNYQSSWTAHNARAYPAASVRSPSIPYAAAAHNFGFANRDRQATVNLVHGSQGAGQYKCDRCSCSFQVREDLVVHQLLCHPSANPALQQYQRPVESPRVPTSVETQPLPSRHPTTSDLGLGYREPRNPYYFGTGFAYVPGNYAKDGYAPPPMTNVNPVMPPPPPPLSPVQSSYVGSRSSVSPVTSHDLTHSVEQHIPNYSGSSNIVHPSVPEALDLSYSDSSLQRHPDASGRGNMNPMRAPAILPYQERSYHQREDENLSRNHMHAGKGYHGLTYVQPSVSEEENLPGRSNVSPLQEHHLSNAPRGVPPTHNVSQDKDHEMEEERPILQLIGEQRPRVSVANERDFVAQQRGHIIDHHRSGMGILRDAQQSEVQSNLAHTLSGGPPLMPLEHRTRDDMSHVPMAATHSKAHEMDGSREMNIPRKKHKSSHHSHMPYDQSGKGGYPQQEQPTKPKKSKKHKNKSDKKSHKHHHNQASAPTGIRKAIEYGTIPPTPPTTSSSSFNRGSHHGHGNFRNVSSGKQTAMASTSAHPQPSVNNRPPLSSSNIAPANSNIDSGKRQPTIQQQPPLQQQQQHQSTQSIPKQPSQSIPTSTQQGNKTINNPTVKATPEKEKTGIEKIIPTTAQMLKALTKEDSVDLSKGDVTGKHQCGKCGNGFQVRSDLDMHLLVFHSLKMPKKPPLKPKTPNEMEKMKQSNMQQTVDDILKMLPNKRKTGGVKGQVKVVSVSYRCQTCDITFLTLVGLEEHQYANHKCRTCDFTFENKEQLQRHKIIAHMCSICGHYFKKDESRKEHPCEENVCTICGERTESKEALLEHNAETHKCSGCRASFLHKSDLIKHRLDKHGHRCEICGYHFKWKEGLKQHMLSTHGMKCMTCKARFTLKEELEKHIMENHKCDICSLFFKSAESLKKHKSFIHTCNMCGKVFKERDKLTKHQYDTHKCGLCNEIFKLTKDLENHKRTIHKCCFCGVVFNSKQLQDNHPCETYKCPCGANYETEDELELHSTNNHFCSFCDTFFLMKDEFRTHRTTNHMCAICETQFNSKANLDKHKNTDHKCKKCCSKPNYEIDNPNMCSCGEKFQRDGKECQPSVQQNGAPGKPSEPEKGKVPVDSVKLNSDTVSTDKPSAIPDSASSTPISVVIKEQTYKYTKEGDEEIPYACEFCNQPFPDGRRQRAHERQCSLNNLEELKRLQDAARLKRNGKKATGPLSPATEQITIKTEIPDDEFDNNKAVPENILPMSDVSKTIPDNFDCVLCSMTFDSQEGLDDHVRDVHLGSVFDPGDVDEDDGDGEESATKQTIKDDSIGEEGSVQKKHKYKCRYCRRGFHYRTQWKRHTQRHVNRYWRYWYPKSVPQKKKVNVEAKTSP